MKRWKAFLRWCDRRVRWCDRHSGAVNAVIAAAAVVGLFASIWATRIANRSLQLDETPAIQLSCSRNIPQIRRAEKIPPDVYMLALDGDSFEKLDSTKNPAKDLGGNPLLDLRSFVKCTLTNYGKLPVLSPELIFAMRTQLNPEQQQRSTTKQGMFQGNGIFPASQTFRIPVRTTGLAPGQAYEFGLLNGSTIHVFIDPPVDISIYDIASQKTESPELARVVDDIVNTDIPPAQRVSPNKKKSAFVATSGNASGIESNGKYYAAVTACVTKQSTVVDVCYDGANRIEGSRVVSIKHDVAESQIDETERELLRDLQQHYAELQSKVSKQANCRALVPWSSPIVNGTMTTTLRKPLGCPGSSIPQGPSITIKFRPM